MTAASSLSDTDHHIPLRRRIYATAVSVLLDCAGMSNLLWRFDTKPSNSEPFVWIYERQEQVLPQLPISSLNQIRTESDISMIRAVTLFAVVSVTALALWTFTSSTPATPQIGPFSNRVILIRHGEKGPQSQVPPSLSLEYPIPRSGQFKYQPDNTGQKSGPHRHRQQSLDHKDGISRHRSYTDHHGEAKDHDSNNKELKHHGREHHRQ